MRAYILGGAFMAAAIGLAGGTWAQGVDASIPLRGAPIQGPNLNMWATAYRIRAEREAARRAAQEQRAEAERVAAGEQEARAIGGLINEGRCGDARARALNNGDFDLAGKIDGLCKLPSTTLPR